MAKEIELQECLLTVQELLEKFDDRLGYAIVEEMEVDFTLIHGILEKLEEGLDEHITQLEERIDDFKEEKESILYKDYSIISTSTTGPWIGTSGTSSATTALFT